VRIQKLTSVDAFVVFDLEGAATSTGVVRAGDKILASSATELARCTTYAYACLGIEKGGASAGINAPEAERADAVAKFVAEVEKLTIDGTFLPDATKTVTDHDLASLRAHDQRVAIDHDAVIARAGLDAMRALGLEMADGRAGIEGFSASSLPLVDQLVQQDARVVAVSTSRGTATSSAGFSAADLRSAVSAHGDDCVNQLGGEVVPSNRIFGVDAEVLFVGSRLGVVNDRSAPFVRARTVVPTGPSPVTAKGFAILQQAGVTLVPDFVVMAAPVVAAWQTADVTEAIAAIVHDIVDEEEGIYLAACRKAEAFLRTWCERLPFGRPLAA
jgi:glutamate dehydrogenase/leucine dehydrogenase